MDDRVNITDNMTQEEIESIESILGITDTPSEAMELHNEVADFIDSANEGSDDVETTDTDEDTQETDGVIEKPKSIRPNSPTLLVEETTSRFSSAIWADKIKEQHIILAGIGGIGSWTALLLARLSPASIHIYDPDTVERVNMSGQLYTIYNVGISKVDSISFIMRDFSSFYNTFTHRRRYEDNDLTSNIMICGFDNMKARKLFYNKWKRRVINSDDLIDKMLFIDGRLAAEEFQVFCIKGDDDYNMKQYEDKWLFDDSEAEATLCSYKQTSHCANMIASVIVNLFVNFIANQCEPLIDRDVPFMTSYNASTMYFKTVS